MQATVEGIMAATDGIVVIRKIPNEGSATLNAMLRILWSRVGHCRDKKQNGRQPASHPASHPTKQPARQHRPS